MTFALAGMQMNHKISRASAISCINNNWAGTKFARVCPLGGGGTQYMRGVGTETAVRSPPVQAGS